MTGIVYLIERIAPGLYLFCAAGLLFWLYRLLRSRRALHEAEFELEREMAEERRAAAITWTIAMIEIALAVFAIANVVAPTVRNDLLTRGVSAIVPGAGDPALEATFITSTPGGDGSAGSGPQLTAAAQGAVAGGQRILLTAVASATPVGIITPGYPTPVDCNTPAAWLEIPAPGQVLFDSVQVIGTANVPDFAFYKFELSGPSTGGAFSPILGDKTSPVAEKGVLGQLPLGSFQPGDYIFRLAVFDTTGTLKASCTVTVVIIPHLPTETPPGGTPLAP